MEQRLKELLSAVAPLNEAAMSAAKERQAQLAKPPGSLGRLEDLSVQLAGISGKVHNSVVKKHLLVFAADNGVVEEGVSSAPQSVTLQQTINLTRHKTGASVLAKCFGCEITVCDVGVNADIKETAVLNKEQAVVYFQNKDVKLAAQELEMSALELLLEPELFARVQGVEALDISALINSNCKEYDQDLTDLVYIRPAVFV